jgi:hypothetical protein
MENVKLYKASSNSRLNPEPNEFSNSIINGTKNRSYSTPLHFVFSGGNNDWPLREAGPTFFSEDKKFASVFRVFSPTALSFTAEIHRLKWKTSLKSISS